MSNIILPKVKFVALLSNELTHATEVFQYEHMNLPPVSYAVWHEDYLHLAETELSDKGFFLVDKAVTETGVAYQQVFALPLSA